MSITLLAIDDVSLPLRKNVCLYLSKPTVRREPVLAPSPADSNAPDNLAAHFYGTVAGSDGLDCPVRWDGRALAELVRRAVRVRVGLKRVGEAPPRVFAIYAREEGEEG